MPAGARARSAEENMARQEGPAIPAPPMLAAIVDFDVVLTDEWNAARERLLGEEKALMKAKDLLKADGRAAACEAMPLAL